MPCVCSERGKKVIKAWERAWERGIMEIRSKKEWVYLKLGMQDSKGTRSADLPNSSQVLFFCTKM